MLSIGLCRWYINITITIMNIIYHPVFYAMFQRPNPVFETLHSPTKDRTINNVQNCYKVKKKNKAIALQAVEAYRIVRC
jgi:hypothetical protein